RIGGIEAAGSHEAIDIFVALVVAHVDNVAAIPVDDAGGAFVLEVAERGSLLWRRARIERIDLDYEAEAIGLVRLLRQVEAVMKLAPGVEIAGHAIAGLVTCFGMSGIGPAREIAVDVLLAGEP